MTTRKASSRLFSSAFAHVLLLVSFYVRAFLFRDSIVDLSFVSPFLSVTSPEFRFSLCLCRARGGISASAHRTVVVLHTFGSGVLSLSLLGKW